MNGQPLTEPSILRLIYPPDLHNFKVARNGSLSNFEHRHRDNAVGTVRFKDEVELFIGLERSNL